MDRFLMHVLITYPPVEDEVEVIRLVRSEEISALGDPAAVSAEAAETERPVPQAAVFAARREIGAIHVSEAMERYMADLVNATRFPKDYGDDLGAGSRLALPRVPRSRWTSAAGPMPGLPDGTMSIRKTCARSLPMSCATGSR